MDTDEQVGASVTCPIVLVFTEPNKSLGYLDNNEVLSALYGDQAPVRIEVNVGEHRNFVQWAMFYPHLDHDERKLYLLQRFSDVPYGELGLFLVSDRFYQEVFNFVLERSGMAKQDAVRVKAIVGDISLFLECNPMAEVARRFFPNASVLVHDEEVRYPMEIGKLLDKKQFD